MKKLNAKQSLEFRNSKNKSDLIIFLSKFTNKIYRVCTINKTTGEGTYDLYESNLSDSFNFAFELGIRPAKVSMLKV